MASVNDKVNLQVIAYDAGTSNSYSFKFKFTSYESFSVALSNYRVVGYFNTFRPSSVIVFNNDASGYSTGGTTGSLSTSNGVINTDFSTVSNPPRIYPTNKRYDKEVIFPFTGSATITAVGGSFTDRMYRLAPTGGQPFISENIGSSIYKSGQTALADGYTYTNNGSYHDDSSFVLEFNDPTYGWIKVKEVTNSSGTPDANTGLYPYDAIYEAHKTSATPNRLYGYDTKYDHDGLTVTLDGFIDQANPNATSLTSTTMSLNGSASPLPAEMRIGFFKFDTSALANKVVSAAEFYTYITASSQDVLVDCSLNTIDVSATSTWNTNAAGVFGTLLSQLSVQSSFSFLNSYVAYNIPYTTVQTWQSAASANKGINLRYDTPTGRNSFNSPTITMTENASIYKPALFVYSGPVAPVSNHKRWQGHTNANWSVASNWEGGVVPSSIDYAVFDDTYSTCACTLDTNQSVLNISAGPISYNGQLNLGSAALTINDTSAFDLSVFTNITTSASTIDFKNNISATFPNNSINTLIFENGSTLGYCQVSANNLIISAGTVKNSDTVNFTITSGGTIQLGSSTILSGSSFYLYMMDSAQVSDANGTIKTEYIAFYGNSIIKSRTYDCSVQVFTDNNTIPYRSSYTSGTCYFTSGTCTFNSDLQIAGTSTTSTYFTIDMKTNSPSLIFNNGLTFNASNNNYINVMFPTGTSTFSGNLTVNSSISATSNTHNSIFSMIGNNIVDGGYSLTGRAPFKFPGLFKSDGLLTLSQMTHNISFDEIEIFNPATVIFNSNALYSSDVLMLSGNNTVSSLAGSIISADTINFFGTSSVYLNMTSTSAWSANAITTLNADYVNLGKSIATNKAGYAIHSLDFGSNVNWMFDIAPPMITRTGIVPSRYSKTQITVSFNAYDAGEIMANDIGLTDSFGIITNKVQADTNNVTFDVVLSGSSKAGYISVSAIDGGSNYSNLIDGPYSYDIIAPTLTVSNVFPASSASSNYVDITVNAIDNCTFDESNSANIFTAKWNGNSISPISITENTSADFTATFRLSSVNIVINGDLYISATDAALNTTTLYSSAITINKGNTAISFASSPSFKVGSTYINVSASFIDVVGLSQLIPFHMQYNNVDLPFTTISASSTKTVLSATIPYTLGAGSLSVTGYNSVSTSATATDSGYDFLPAIIFGDPVPNNISKTSITVPISAIGSFTTDPNNYYCKLQEIRMPVSQPVSGTVVIEGFTFDLLHFSATISSVNDLRGDLILSAGYN